MDKGTLNRTDQLYASARELLCEAYAKGMNRQEIKKRLYQLNIDSVLSTPKAVLGRLDAVRFFDELFSACVLMAAKRQLHLSAYLPRLPYFCAADYRVLRLAVCELLTAAFTESQNAEIAMDVTATEVVLMSAPTKASGFPVARHAAELHGGLFKAYKNTAEMRIPAAANGSAYYAVTAAFDYLDEFSPVGTNLLFPEVSFL